MTNLHMITPERHYRNGSLRIYANLQCSRFLDIGCGDGELTVSLADACGAVEAHGIDVSASAVRMATMRGVNAILADIDEQDLPYAAGTFDTVYSGEVLGYLDDPDHFFEEIYRCLVDDGVFVLTVPNLSAIHNRIALLCGNLPYPMRAATDVLSPDDSPTPLSKRRSLYTYEKLYETIEKHGFTVQQTAGASAMLYSSSTLVRVFDAVATRFPSMSYRNIFVCKKPR